MKKFYLLFLIQLFALGAYAQYCTPGYSAGPTGGDSIVSIVSGGLTGNYPGSLSGYNNYTSVDTLVVSTGNTFTLTITNNPGFAESVAVWLDYNLNNSFDANERVGFLNMSPGQVGTITFTVPAASPVGFSRMRMVAAWGTQANAINPCGNYVWGETEDYTLFVRPPIANDMQLTSIVPYGIGCGLSATSPVNVTLTNNGYNNVSSLPVAYSINGGTPVTATATGAYVAGSTNPYTFTTTANFSAPNTTFILKVWTMLPGDQVPANDTATYTFTTPPPTITTFPYVQNFESGQGGWTASGTNSSWAFGTPAKTTINTAGSGVNSWVTGGLGTGFYNASEKSQVAGPCFDFTALTLPRVRLKVWWNSEFSWDGANLQSSIDGGLTWQNVGALNDPNNWYNDGTINGNPGGSQVGWTGRGTANGSQGWRVAENALTGLAGQSSVKFRISFGADASVLDDGFAFDDFEIFEAPVKNIKMISQLSPISGCGLGTTNTVQVRFTHIGSQPVTGINLSYRINGGGVVTENYTPTVNPGDTVNYTFSTTANLSTQGTVYNFISWLAATGDTDPTNDTTTRSVTNIPLVSTFPYTQTFESGTGGWTAGGTLPSWALGTPAKTNIIGAAGGVNSWVTGGLGTGTYNPGEQSYVLGPCFNFSTLVNPIITFDIWWFSESSFDGTALQASTDNGLTWVNVGNFGDPNNWYNSNFIFGPGPGFAAEGWVGSFGASSGGWVEAKNFLGGLGGQSSVLLRVAFGADTFVQYDGFAFDNIQIFEAPAKDLAMLNLESPTLSACGLGAAVPVSVQYTHLGSQQVSSVNFSYQINGGTVVTENSTLLVNPGDTLIYNFVTTANLSVPGQVYNIKTWLAAAGDTYVLNDSTSGSVTNIPTVSTFPYLQNFESGTGGWTSGGTLSSWAFGTPAKSVINSAQSGANAWVTGGLGSGTYNANEDSYVLGPCFNFTSLTVPKVRLGVWWNSEFSWDGANLQSSIDGGVTWQLVGALNDPVNWYNDGTINGAPGGFQTGWTGRGTANGSQGWRVAEHDLTGLAGQSSVRLRIAFGADGSINDNGFAFDNFEIFEPIPIDAAVTQISKPVTGCGLSAADSIRVTIKNFGTDTLFSVPLNYTLNGVLGTAATYSDTLLPGASVPFTFPTTLNLATLGFYTVKAFSTVPTDPNATNDTTTKIVENQSGIAAFPYFENFEGGQGAWTSGGTSSTWAFGTPAKSVINSAGSGTKSWVTGGLTTGTYNAGEQSYVLGPCMDFSSLSTPVFRAKVWWNSEFSWDGANLQGSIDGGVTWLTIGNLNDPNNWYNDGTINGTPGGVQIGWTGRNSTSNGSGGWVVAENFLTGLAGQSNVKLRIAFGSDTSVQDNGFAFDDVEVFEAPAFNAKMISYLGPKSGCGLSDTAHITVRYAHLGSLPINSITFGYKIGSGAVVTETSNLTVNPGDTLVYTYTTPANLSAVGTTYNVSVFLNATGDTDNANDSLLNRQVTHYPAVSTFPYSENFDGPGFPNTTAFPWGTPIINMANGWLNSQDDRPQDWGGFVGASPSFGTGPSADHTTGITGAGAGRYLMATDNGFDNDSVILLTPCYDVSALQAPKFSFWYHSLNGAQPNNENFLHIDLIFNGDIIYDIVQPIGHKGPNWNFVEIPLTNYIGVVGFRFRVDNNNNFGFQHSFAIDDIALVNVPDFDGGVTDLLAPLSGCGLTANENLALLVENLGADSISNFQVSYQVNGGTVFTTTVVDTLEPGGSAAVTFPGVNFATAGVYTITAWTSGIAGDPISSNDTLITTVTSIPTIATYPYFQDFESGQGGWRVDPNSNVSSWAFGTPAKSVIIGASSGVNAWVTGGLSTGTYNSNEESQVVGPCFNLSSVSNPVISLDVWWNSEFSWDGANIQSSIDNGATWQTIGAVGDPTNWYNDGTINGTPGGVQIGWTGSGTANGSQGWRTASHDMTGLGGQSNVLLRVAFGADASIQDNGFAFDNLRIFDRLPDDVGIVAVSEPVVTSCSGDSIPIFVQLVNFGADTQTTVPVQVNITGTPTSPNPLLGTFTGTLPPGDTAVVLVGYANFGLAGTYNLYASSNLTGDTNFANDSTLGRSFVTLSELAPMVFNDSICATDSASFTLMASSATATSIFWFDSAVAGNRVFIGDTFNTPTLTANRTYYAQAVSPTFANVGPVDNTFGAGANYTFFGDGLVFNALSDFKLRSVKVYPSSAGNIVVRLLSSAGTVLQTKTIAYGGTAVDTTITLDFDILAGTGYRLDATGSTVGGLYRNSGGAVFPYSVNNVVNLTGTINGLGTGGFYYFFYNWSVEVLGCPSPRVPVTARFLPPVAVDLGADAVVCAGFVLDASAPGVVSYQWNGDPNITGPTLAATASGVYYVDVVNAAGCTGSDTINVTALPSPTVDLGADTSVCNSIVLNAGNAGATYAWSVPGQTGQIVSATQSGNYFVNVTLNGCTSTDTVAVTILPGPQVSLGTDRTTCRDITFDAGNAGSTYAWSNGATTQTVTVSAPITLSVVVGSANGCADQDTISLTLGSAPVVNLGPNAAICDSIILDAGANAGGSYLWSTGATTRTIVADTTTTYSVTVTDSIGCEGVDDITLAVAYSPDADFTFFYTGTPLTFTFTNGSTAGTYLWDFGDGTTSNVASPTHTFPFDGTYEVKLIVTNDCGSDSIKTLLQNVSIFDEQFSSLIDIYPNPNDGLFFVSSKDLNAKDLVIEVYDFTGKKVLVTQLGDVFGGFKYQVDLTEQAEGAYLMRITDGQRVAIKRIVRK